MEALIPKYKTACFIVLIEDVIVALYIHPCLLVDKKTFYTFKKQSLNLQAINLYNRIIKYN